MRSTFAPRVAASRCRGRFSPPRCGRCSTGSAGCAEFARSTASSKCTRPPTCPRCRANSPLELSADESRGLLPVFLERADQLGLVEHVALDRIEQGLLV